MTSVSLIVRRIPVSQIYGKKLRPHLQLLKIIFQFKGSHLKKKNNDKAFEILIFKKSQILDLIN